MRGIKNYTFKEWLRLDPPIWYLKEKRNDFLCNKFINDKPETLEPFIEKHKHLAGKNIAVVVAFNSPWVIEIQLPALKRFLNDAEILVCDNSNKTDLRPEIEKACATENISYFSLPPNPEKHPCRSHGIALNWIYYNLLKPLNPQTFACIDHDLIPFREISIEQELGDQSVYGQCRKSPWSWFIWAGYGLFNFKAVKDKAVNFNNDRPSLLDTGGRNWDSIFKHLDADNMRFATSSRRLLKHPANSETMEGEVLDDTWLHLEGVGQTKGRKDYFTPKARFYADVFEEVAKGKPLSGFFIE